MSRPSVSPMVVAGEEALATFRRGLTGARALEMLREAQGRLLVHLAVGVGKTEWLIQIILHVLTINHLHDLVVVLVPRWDVLRELLGRLPANLLRLVLRPRPRNRCGSLDADWLRYEQNGCGLLGREVLCGKCPRRKGCHWPGQYGERLRKVRLILATQQHLAVNPQFISHLCLHGRAKNPLVLFDESDFLIRSAERFIRRQDLVHFVGAQEATTGDVTELKGATHKWMDLSRLLSMAPTPDLRGGRWSFPPVNRAWATRVQRRGLELFGQDFRFLGYELHHFARSDRASRERLASGDLRFAVPPFLGRQFIVFSGSIAIELARYRLDPDHARPAPVSPFQDHRFEHPSTRWYNLGTLDGAASYFPSNAERILDFFAAKIGHSSLIATVRGQKQRRNLLRS